MSRRAPLLRTLTLGVVVIAASVPLRAQEAVSPRVQDRDAEAGSARAAESVEAELVRRIDALVPRLEAAAERARRTNETRAAIRRANETQVETVELTVGPLRVVTLPGQEDVARRLISSELERLGPLAHSRAAPLGRTAIVFQFAPTLERIRFDGPAHAVEVRSFWGEGAVRRRIRDVLGGEIGGALPPIVRFWMGSRPLRTAEDPRSLHRALVLDGSRSGTACARGAPAGCWASLGLSGGEDPIREWYTPEQVERLARHRGFGGWLECVQSGRVAETACYHGFLSSALAWSRAIPFNHAMRADLVAFALELGGAGALDRFLEGWPEEAMEPIGSASAGTGGPGMALPELGRQMQTRLAAAAGVPPEELMRRWHRRVTAVKVGPEERAAFDRTRLSAAFWLLFFAALAMRSTRWRLG